MRNPPRPALTALVLLAPLLACQERLTPADDCAGDACGATVTAQYLACTVDSDCPSGLCGRDGICLGTQPCFVTAECPIDLYCNIALALPVCSPLGPGACREDSHCAVGVCSAVQGGLGTCLECLTHDDCASGTCNIDGSCAPDDGSARAPTCPDYAHVDGTTCVCDDGYALDPASALCVEATVAPPPSTNPEPTTPGDTCEAGGLYGDGSCDPGCPLPDPDCEAPVDDDPCAAYGYYGDGECDTFCAEPDPDCEATVGDDRCAAYGYYGDGVCDDFCAEPDPDCEVPDVQEGDPCGDVTWYGLCDGDRVIYCYRNAIDIVECSGNLPYCGLVDVEHGYDCMATPG